MLTVRKEQMRVLGRRTLNAFEERVCERMTEGFPEVYEALGVDGIRRAVSAGIDKALRYDFQSERDLAQFVCLVFTFGADFDADPEQPWAREILKSPLPPDERMDRLAKRAAQFEHRGRGLLA